jgi:hypothetical protein
MGHGIGSFEVDVALLLLYNDRYEVVPRILEYFKCKLHRQITIKGSQIIS